MQNEQGKKRKVLYILLALLAAISMWIYADEFGNNGGHRLIEKTITELQRRDQAGGPWIDAAGG